MRAEHQQVSTRGRELPENFIVDVLGLLNADVHTHIGGHPDCHFAYRLVQRLPIGLLQYQWKRLHGGPRDKHVQQRELCLVPVRDGCSVIQRVLRDFGEVNRTQYACDANHVVALLSRYRAGDAFSSSPPLVMSATTSLEACSVPSQRASEFIGACSRDRGLSPKFLA